MMKPAAGPDVAAETGETPDPQGVEGVNAIVSRLQALPANPVTRARIRVEQEVPLARRGPGWDRHWRELEAYLDSPAEWKNLPEPE
jgi:hypothetical protein